jgi:hypothetical protein
MEMLFAGVAVANFAIAVAWYHQLFGRPPDIVVNDNDVRWRVADAAWLYVTQDQYRAGHALVTVSVPDQEQTVQQKSVKEGSPALQLRPSATRGARHQSPTLTATRSVSSR